MEDLSLKNAERNEKRMTADVVNTRRMGHPPRVDPPLSARESLSPRYTEEVNESDLYEGTSPVDDAVSARRSGISPNPQQRAAIGNEHTREHVARIMSSLGGVSRLCLRHNTRPTGFRSISYVSPRVPFEECLCVSGAIVVHRFSYILHSGHAACTEVVVLPAAFPRYLQIVSGGH